MVWIGLIVFFTGLVLLSVMALVEAPDSDDYKTAEAYDKAVEERSDLLRGLFGSGRLLIVIGGLVESLALIGAGVGNADQDVRVRVVSISAGIAFVISVLVVLSIFGSYYY